MELMRSGAAAGVKRVGVDGRENPWTAGGVDALDSTGETLLIGTGEPRFDPGITGAGEWHRLTVGLCVGVVRVRSGCEMATQLEGKKKGGCCGESMAEVDIILCILGGTLMDLGCCC